MTDWALHKLPHFSGVPGPVLVVVMDGVGIGAHNEGDAVWLAKTPTLDWLQAHALTTTLQAHGKAVGLPSDDDMGNSEVGHNALGAGRVFDQGAKRVNEAIQSGEIFTTEIWHALVERVRKSDEPMHFIGLVSNGNVHSHIDHLFAMIRRCDADGVKKVRVHALLDGRDVPKQSAHLYIEPLEALLKEISSKSHRDYQIASGGGRMTITMDRYNADWSMVDRGYKHHVHGQGRGFASASQALSSMRQEDPDIGDQDLGGFVVVDDLGKPVGPIRDGASVVFFNFRGDRAIEISRALTETEFSEFDRGPLPDILFAGMMQYDGDLFIPKNYLVSPPQIDRTSGEYMVKNGIKIFACSETQKFGHVTYFWNGNRSGMFDPALESYQEVPSDRISFDQAPEMKAKEITDATIAALESGAFRCLRINYANGDMVGHTGTRDAAIKAIETVDASLARLLPVIQKLNGAMIVTADHGNADEMYEIDKTGKFALDNKGQPKVKTSHTLNPVPCYIVLPPGMDLRISSEVLKPGLANVAATTLHLLGYGAPIGYEPSLLS